MDTSKVRILQQNRASSNIIMEFNHEDNATKLFQAQSHVFNHIFSFINSMSLKCAIDLCIPDIIHNYVQPMPLSKLIASLPIHPSKTKSIFRLMRILTNSGFFIQHNVTENELEVRYELTDASRLLIKDHPFSMSSSLHCILDPILTEPWYQFSTWFKNEDPTPFYTKNGMSFWEYFSHNPKHRHRFNDAMASDTRLVSSAVMEKCKGVFKGLETLVDVGGGTGTFAKAIAKSFPQLECIVFDLPHVVSGLQGSENIKYVGGNMFEAIPATDSILLKWILHDWNDEECMKILKNCKEAISKKGKRGKVIIIDVVIGNEKGDSESIETKLFYDLEMMALLGGKERDEKEWAKLIFSVGFSNYKITPVLGLRSLIEVYP
ncbi:trans-resveratrol di-O-methyltransferase-like [Lotus japonicus]|uniref:trans-resveratrol di-O-methyltransferase-like n=1 Tax=Lotus japonicus TaxID=34305 RepID=UPI00258E104F|nr:trans-resveratrol di-O-methyltransferase-like [Lotus japonicus]